MREQRMGPQQAPDWGKLISDVVETGLTHTEIGIRMGAMLSASMVRKYSTGVQPVHFRGEALIALWCERRGEEREALPMLEVVRGYRAGRGRLVNVAPRMQDALQLAALVAAIAPPKQKAPTGAPRKTVRKTVKAKADA